MHGDATLPLLMATAVSTALFHTLIPDHWLPFVLIGRARGWTGRTTFLVSGLSAAIHVLLSAVLTACAGSAEKTVSYTATSVDLAPGEALVVEFGEVNGSVGDAWVLTQEPDPAILGEGEELTRALGDAPGSPSFPIR